MRYFRFCYRLGGFVFILTLLFQEGYSQKQDKKALKAALKAELLIRRQAEEEKQRILDTVEYQKALLALQENRWAFETREMMDHTGLPVPGQHHPNVVGYNGEELVALIVYRVAYRRYGEDKEDISYKSEVYNGKVIKQEHATDKKGRFIYRYSVMVSVLFEVVATLLRGVNGGQLLLMVLIYRL